MPYRPHCSSSSSRPVWSGSRPISWRATPIRRRTSAPSAWPPTPPPPALPPVGGSSVQSIRTVVVLPAPFGPRKPKTSPAATSRSIPRTASTPPLKVRTSARASMAGVASLMRMKVERRRARSAAPGATRLPQSGDPSVAPGSRYRHMSKIGPDADHWLSLSSELFCTLDLDGRLLAAGDAWADSLGYAPDELRGTPLARLAHPDDRGSVA